MKTFKKRIIWGLAALFIQYILTASLMRESNWIPSYIEVAPPGGISGLLAVTLVLHILVQTVVTITSINKK